MKASPRSDTRLKITVENEKREKKNDGKKSKVSHLRVATQTHKFPHNIKLSFLKSKFECSDTLHSYKNNFCSPGFYLNQIQEKILNSHELDTYF